MIRTSRSSDGSSVRTLDRLFGWLALYVFLLFAICALAGKLADAIPVLTNLISGFAGAAFAIMRLRDDSHSRTRTPVSNDLTTKDDLRP